MRPCRRAHGTHLGQAGATVPDAQAEEQTQVEDRPPATQLEMAEQGRQPGTPSAEAQASSPKLPEKSFGRLCGFMSILKKQAL